MLDKTKNYKIDVSALSTAERTALQEELFKMGYRWADGTKTVINLDKSFLCLFKDKSITYCDADFFKRSEYHILTPSDIMPQPEERTLRDWFAGLALNGMLPSDSEPLEILARDAYRYADAMLKERNK